MMQVLSLVSDVFGYIHYNTNERTLISKTSHSIYYCYDPILTTKIQVYINNTDNRKLADNQSDYLPAGIIIGKFWSFPLDRELLVSAIQGGNLVSLLPLCCVII